MQNYKKSFFLSFFIHLLLVSVAVFLVLFIHQQYKKKETFIAVKLFKIPKSAGKHKKTLHKKNMPQHKIIQHRAKHDKIKKRVVHKYHKIRHLLKQRKIVKKHVKKIKPAVNKNIPIKHKIIKKNIISRTTNIKPHLKHIKHIISNKAVVAKKVKTVSKIKHIAVNPVMAQKIKHNYFDYLYEMINTHKAYPLIARKLQQEGVVKIGFMLLNNGEILHVKIVKSSGFDSLDNAAKAILIQLHKIKPVPRTLSQKPLHIVIPIDYTLN